VLSEASLARRSPTPGERDPALAALLIGPLMVALGTAMHGGGAFGATLEVFGVTLTVVAVIWLIRLR
jgi:hypothetical protein